MNNALKFITYPSVDDGKSTLIGRLLYESHMVFEDHLAQLEVDSAKVGTQGTDLDFALLLDGTVIYPAAHEKTRRRMEEQGIKVAALDVSEVLKAEGGVTCCSLVFEK